MHNKWSIYWQFYKSTFLINFLISVAFAIIAKSVLVFGGVFCSVGFLVSWGYKEITHKNVYYYYYNAGITKTQLLLANFLINVLLIIILISIVTLCLMFLK